MTEKALAKGSECPPLEKDKIRLYGMRFCPYVKRVRLVLEEKNVDYETVNINLDEKPEWFLNRYPEGKVPALVQNDKALSDSLIITEYLDDLYPSPKLQSEDFYQKAQDKLTLSKFDRVTNNFGRAVTKPKEVKEALQEVILGLEVFEQELATRTTPFFDGEKPMMMDLMMWPFFEILLISEYYLGPGYLYDDLLEPNKFRNLRAWVKIMSLYPVVKQLTDNENLKMYAESYRHGKRNFDVGL